MVAADPLSAYSTDRLVIRYGDVVAIHAPASADGRHLLRILATLEPPDAGHYHFNGKRIDLNNYQACLSTKRQIGYVAADAAMISNRTVRENLLLTRYYYENDLTIEIDETLGALCRGAGLSEYLDWRPSEMSSEAQWKAIMIREMAKQPMLMLVDQPETFMGIAKTDVIFNHLKNMIQSSTAVVFISHDRTMTDLANRRLTLAAGKICTRPV
ncbi:MAG: ATP-binding cassette domain-containing protein [Desulfosarcina sp.]|jgi:ABC-type lipoprotein export system ATPase subunit